MGNIRIASWNVNSIRARIEILSKWLKQKKYDIVFIQETKVQDHEFPSKHQGHLDLHPIRRIEEKYHLKEVKYLKNHQNIIGN